MLLPELEENFLLTIVECCKQIVLQGGKALSEKLNTEELHFYQQLVSEWQIQVPSEGFELKVLSKTSHHLMNI